jgi:diacylglycerol kinase (ATP)
VGLTSTLVIVNPAAGRGQAVHVWTRVSARVPHLKEVECVTTEAPGHARRLAHAAATRGVERVVAVGGDGTVSEVAGGLAGSQVALGVVPAGTGNDFSRALGLPSAPEIAARLALDGSTRWVDLGHVRTAHQRVAFVNVAGCGFDAEVVRRTRSGRRAGGALMYLIGILQTLTAFRPVPMGLVVDGQWLERRALGIAVAIGPRYGGGMLVAPHAVLDDGLFDVCLIGDIDPLELLALLPRLYAGTHGGHHAVQFFRCRELTVEPLAAADVSCQADGELLDKLPATFGIQPRALLCVTGQRK